MKKGKKRALCGEDYGFMDSSWREEDNGYYEMSNSFLRRAYDLYVEENVGDGPKILDEVLRRAGKPERLKAFLNGVEFEEGDLMSLDLFYLSNEMKINPKKIFQDKEKKQGLLKNIFKYSALIVGKDKLTGKIKYKPLNSCKDERIGKVFFSKYERGKTLDELIKS